MLSPLLLVEDDGELAGLLTGLLTEEGYAVTRAADGQQALHLLLTRSFDLVILDRGLPVVEGLSLLATVRGTGVTTPVLVLSARGTVTDRVDGLDAGASDYLAKPFEVDELLARLRALRRRTSDERTVLPLGERTLDVPAQQVLGDPPVDLTDRETRLLAHLARHPRSVLSKAELHAETFSADSGLDVVDSYVSYLRRKLGPGCIETVRGVGFRLGRA